MAPSIECPACDESFAVPRNTTSSKVICPACGNISRIPGSTRPTADKADRHETGLRVAERLPAEPPESPPAPPPVTPPLRKPPIAVSTDPAIQVVTDASSRVAVNRDTESSGSPGNEKRRRRRKTSAAWLWGTILAGGFTIIGLAIFANYINDRKQQKTVALRDPLNTTDSSPSAAPEVDSSRPSTRPVQPLVDNPEPFAPFEDAQEPMDDPLLQQFKESEQPAPPEPSEPEGPRGFTPDAVQELYEQCHEMEWNPETLAAYGKLQALAKIVTDCGRSQESEVLDAEHKEEMLKASLRVMDSLSTIRWPEINQRTRINEFATEALQDQQQLGVFGYGEVYVTAAGQLDGADVVLFRLAGTDQHIAITVKENSGELTPGTRWLILGECNFTRGIQLMDNNTGNTIKAPLVMAYYLIQEPK